MNELALFAGAGGGILGGKLLGWQTVCAVEINGYGRNVLVARQNDGCLPAFPIWDDIRSFDGLPWRGVVDVVSGGFPCQDISAAGKGAGIKGYRSGLWQEMARVVSEVRPRYVWVENSPLLVGRGLALVLLDLAAMGFDARWGVVGACEVGAPHKRERIWIWAGTQGRGEVANTVSGEARKSAEWERGQDFGRGGVDCRGIEEAGTEVSHANIPGWEGPNTTGDTRTGGRSAKYGQRRRQTDWWETEPDLGRVAYGVAARVDRLRCIGNGQVPAVAAKAWNMLKRGIE